MSQPVHDALALWTVRPGVCELRAERLPALAPSEVRVETLFTGVSRGTERLVFSGKVPDSVAAHMRAPFQGGEFPFPVKYGYAAVGRVTEGPHELVGRIVFALHPHQDRFVIPAEAALPLPEGVPPARAVLAANMETALNALWDSGAGPGDRIVIVGAGALGALVAALAGRMPGTEVTLVDVAPERARFAARLGVGFAAPAEAPHDADVVIHASASAAGLSTALACAGVEARVVELSWHGTAEVAIPLGGAFHSKRLALISSQVGRVSPARRPRWPHRKRLAKALELLRDERLDGLLGPPVPFAELPARMAALLEGRDPCPLIAYGKN